MINYRRLRGSRAVCLAICFILIAGCDYFSGNGETTIPYTAEENRTRKSRDAIGTLVAKLVDERTGQPITACCYNEYRYSLDRELVEQKPFTQISWLKPSESPEGVHEFEFPEGFYLVSFAADGYRPTPSGKFQITRGQVTELSLTMKPSNRLRITVLDQYGNLCPKGTLLLIGSKVKSAQIIKGGIVETEFDSDEVEIVVNPTFMPGYMFQSIRKKLLCSELNDITIKVYEW